jgi:hypothetical protein
VTALILIPVVCAAVAVAVLFGDRNAHDPDQRGWWFGSARR